MPKSQTSPTTGLSRRHGPVVPDLGYPSRFAWGSSARAEPATPTVLPRPFGELEHAPADHIAEHAYAYDDRPLATRKSRRDSTRDVLGYLGQFDGHGWQQKWDASRLGTGAIRAADVGPTIMVGIRTLYCLRVVRPTLLAFRTNPPNGYSTDFIVVQRDPMLEHFALQASTYDFPQKYRYRAVFDVTVALTVQGISLADLTPEAMLHHTHEMRRVNAILQPEGAQINRFNGQSAWTVLHAMGHFPADTPRTMREALHRGQLSIEELIDRYPIANQPMRQLLIEYFRRRAADTDYSSLKNLILMIAHHFWVRIEQINPGQADLRISADTYTRWREAIKTREDGKPRTGQDVIIIGVRSFYYDLHTWAAEEPEQWAVWVAPCPVPPAELRGLGARRRRINDRSASRTRIRQPLLPILVRHVEDRYDRARTLLGHARAVEVGETFVHEGRTYRRIERPHHAQPDDPIRVRDEATGTVVHVQVDEEATFWDWACVETLRHSGARIEEMCELTHLSIRQYQRPNGEVIALLVIAPSKTDRERVIPMSAELFHVIAAIVRRHTSGGRTISTLSRFDNHDKIWSAPLPFLFQRKTGPKCSVIATGTVLNQLKRLCTEIAEHNPAFHTVKFTPHDFRRIFATELVNSGLPIHIGAALLGHMNIQTTRGYVAVFDDDIVHHYTAFLEERRRLRPTDEYRPLTTGEWDEFDGHFDKRKVELGSCGRPYGTGCQHEHACIRCPMLHVDPRMIPRLDELEDDLLQRRQRAEAEGWAGEIEGIDLTLTFLRAKRDDSQRRMTRPTVTLGLPAAPRLRAKE
ncbi:tyrosine-type recombinase/integrase [Nocardia farcinica]|uniref:tyrosine-type recombinase/integrase n=2 Tax=Nocardia farcinica TaxID=37329 RepID=UPI0022B9EAF9|nr:site-specific integrase [Nocardia farcinica]MCZ9329402.1 site-specific integrase [Nocardia farcinica]